MAVNYLAPYGEGDCGRFPQKRTKAADVILRAHKGRVRNVR
ncbi:MULTISPECIES: hypothetical protein [unclassified Rhizobium]|nr:MULTISPECIES: hypothetical protein [unclassified Rhizobium]